MWMGQLGMKHLVVHISDAAALVVRSALMTPGCPGAYPLHTKAVSFGSLHIFGADRKPGNTFHGIRSGISIER